MLPCYYNSRFFRILTPILDFVRDQSHTVISNTPVFNTDIPHLLVPFINRSSSKLAESDIIVKDMRIENNESYFSISISIIVEQLVLCSNTSAL